MKTYNDRTNDVLKKVSDKKRRRKHIITASALALCGAFIVSANLALFLPFSTTDILAQYADSEYFPLIEQINSLSPKQTTGYKNNFEKLQASFQDFWYDTAMGGGLNEDDMIFSPSVDINYGASVDSSGNNAGTLDPDYSYSETTNGSTYEEVTDNQVSGIIEGDLFKRSNDKLFYITGMGSTYYTADTLVKGDLFMYIYSIDGKNSSLLAACDVTKLVTDFNLTANKINDVEMFLSNDCNTVTLVADSYTSSGRATAIVNFDVSDIDNITASPTITMSGTYVSARMVENDLYVISSMTINPSNWDYDYSNQSKYVPTINDGDGAQLMSMDKIIMPKCATTNSITIACRYDYDSQSLADDIALYSYSSDIYVSDNSIYAINTANIDYTTEIARIKYDGEKLEHTATYTVNGAVNDRYSLDEKDGILRVFSTTYTYNHSLFESSASLYCIDLESERQVANIENFAPIGESVRSARFNGDIAYVCTAVNLSDPVYAFDLSDYNNITYSDSGTITGYSTSLVSFKDNTLLGIGYENSLSSYKIQIYDGTTAEVITTFSIDEKTIGLESPTISTDYKSYYINKNNGYIGLGVVGYKYSNLKYMYQLNYLLLQYNDGQIDIILMNLMDADAKMSSPKYVRATIIDNYIYMLSGDKLFVEDYTVGKADDADETDDNLIIEEVQS
jgi:uncharacterized secreted protein with C-terminal beta-propeller domain